MHSFSWSVLPPAEVPHILFPQPRMLQGLWFFYRFPERATERGPDNKEIRFPLTKSIWHIYIFISWYHFLFWLLAWASATTSKWLVMLPVAERMIVLPFWWSEYVQCETFQAVYFQGDFSQLTLGYDGVTGDWAHTLQSTIDWSWGQWSLV